MTREDVEVSNEQIKEIVTLFHEEGKQDEEEKKQKLAKKPEAVVVRANP